MHAKPQGCVANSRNISSICGWVAWKTDDKISRQYRNFYAYPILELLNDRSNCREDCATYPVAQIRML
jgi:hypothetical protein